MSGLNHLKRCGKGEHISTGKHISTHKKAFRALNGLLCLLPSPSISNVIFLLQGSFHSNPICSTVHMATSEDNTSSCFGSEMAYTPKSVINRANFFQSTIMPADK